VAPVAFKDLLLEHSFSIIQNPPVSNTFRLFPDEHTDFTSSGLFCVLSIDRLKCLEFDVSISDIVGELYALLPSSNTKSFFRILYPEDLEFPLCHIYVAPVEVIEFCSTSSLFTHPHYAVLHDAVIKIIRNAEFKGIKGLSNATVSRYKHTYYSHHVRAVDPEWVLHVDGSCMHDVCQLDWVDSTRIYSNDPHDVLKQFGIEAARQSMKNEIRTVLQFDGSYVNIRHVYLLVDWMCFIGKLAPFTRFGMAMMSNSVLKLSSFERVLHFVTEGADSTIYDSCRGASENIILGSLPSVGTGKIDLFLDIEKCKQVVAPKANTFEIDTMGTPFPEHLTEYNWENSLDNKVNEDVLESNILNRNETIFPVSAPLSSDNGYVVLSPDNTLPPLTEVERPDSPLFFTGSYSTVSPISPIHMPPNTP
jgi:hypothetical protein